MPANAIYPAKSFEEAYTEASGYQVSTPYGTVTITDNGRRVAFELYPDIRQSIHHKALFSYYNQLVARNILQINLDHLDIKGLDKSLDLRRGNKVLDCVYVERGQLHEIELKTHREIGLEQTARQLKEFVKTCTNLTIVVPRTDLVNMQNVLIAIGISEKVKVDTYDIREPESDY
jgi:hypothetical protein